MRKAQRLGHAAGVVDVLPGAAGALLGQRRAVIEKLRPGAAEPGEIVHADGRVLGEHPGVIHYTIGQRRGLGIASHRPLYVSQIDAASNRVVVSHHEHRSNGLVAIDCNWIAFDRIELPLDVQVKIRLRHKATDATVYPPDGDQTRILFKKPQMSVTPGQSAVIYDDDTVLGGGIINAVL